MIVAFSVTPLGTGASVADEVTEAVRVVRESGLPHRTDAMFTTLEGSWEEVMDVIRGACDAVLERTERVSLVLKADIRPGQEPRMDQKVEAVEQRLGSE